MKDDKAKRTVVVIPCYNEEMTIGKVIEDYQKILPDADIIIIDNNCSDRTVAIASDLGASIIKEPCQGKGCAVRRAFHEIVADVYILVDGDNTYPPDEAICKMRYMILNDGYEMVIGNRLDSDYFKKNRSLLHGVGNIIVPLLFKSLYHVNTRDIMSGSRALSKKFVSAFPASSDDFVLETEMMIYAVKARLKTGEVPIHYQDRPEGSKSKINPIRDGVRIIKAIIKGKP